MQSTVVLPTSWCIPQVGRLGDSGCGSPIAASTHAHTPHEIEMFKLYKSSRKDSYLKVALTYVCVWDTFLKLKGRRIDRMWVLYQA